MTLRRSDLQVQVSLVAADRSVRPGHPVTVALRLEHPPHWHTYWINAGTGYPTSLRWELPQGWTAGAIQWPTPLVIKDDQDDVIGNGYTGVLYLSVVLTAPRNERPGGVVTLKAMAKWLMCGDVCMPSATEVSLTLPVSAQTPEPDPVVRAQLAQMPLPQPPPNDWKMVAIRNPDQVVLRVWTARVLGSPHFFSEDGFIQYNAEQRSSMANGALSVTLQLADDADATAEELVGVLACTDGGVYRGVIVKVPLQGG